MSSPPQHSTALHERSVGLAVVRRRNDASSSWELLVVSRRKRGNDGRLSVELPKGHVEEGETLHQAAIRELEEEAGASGVLVGSELCRTTYQVRSKHRDAKGAKVDKTVSFYHASPGENFTVDASKREKGTLEVLWVTAAEAVGKGALVNWKREQQLVVLQALTHADRAAAQSDKQQERTSQQEPTSQHTLSSHNSHEPRSHSNQSQTRTPQHQEILSRPISQQQRNGGQAERTRGEGEKNKEPKVGANGWLPRLD
eukprot:g65195.t1